MQHILRCTIIIHDSQACVCAVPCRAVPCRAVPCRAVPCRAVPCRAVPCHAAAAAAAGGVDVDAGRAGMSDMEMAKLMQDDDLGADPDTLMAGLR